MSTRRTGSLDCGLWVSNEVSVLGFCSSQSEACSAHGTDINV